MSLLDRVPGPLAPEVEALASGFTVTDRPGPLEYSRLFQYFVAGFLEYRRPDGAGSRVPGLPSTHDAAADEMEGFSRIAPLLAAWLHGGRVPTLTLPDGTSVDLAELLRQGLSAGTDPASPGYWGVVGDHDQRTVEAADIALAIWLARGPVWDRLESGVQRQITAWLASARGREVPDNNWHLLITFIDEVLGSLGAERDVSISMRHYERMKEFYRGGGWFSDGPHEVFDYYNAWGIHYLLSWLRRVNPAFDSGFIRQAQLEFAESFRHFIGPAGLPIFGRSVCYRLALPAPLVFAALDDPDVVSPGQARRALDCTWRHFILRGALRGGTVTQGYYRYNPAIVDQYSGPSSCLWSLRSLVAAFAIPETGPFWIGGQQPLPVEEAHYRIRVAAARIDVTGAVDSSEIVVERWSGGPAPRLVRFGLLARILTRIRGRPYQPWNHEAKYLAGRYSSAVPFCEE